MCHVRLVECMVVRKRNCGACLGRNKTIVGLKVERNDFFSWHINL